MAKRKRAPVRTVRVLPNTHPSTRVLAAVVLTELAIWEWLHVTESHYNEGKPPRPVKPRRNWLFAAAAREHCYQWKISFPPWLLAATAEQDRAGATRSTKRAAERFAPWPKRIKAVLDVEMWVQTCGLTPEQAAWEALARGKHAMSESDLLRWYKKIHRHLIPAP